MFGFDARTRVLLDAVRREGSISAAARALGIDASNARRHIRTAERRMGAPLVAARRGGRGGRNAKLATAARRMLDAGALAGRAGAYEAASGVTPIRVANRVLFAAGRHEGVVRVDVPPESVAIARAAPPSSARNHLRGLVERIDAAGEGVWRVKVRCGALALDALLVTGAVKELRLRRGSRVVAIVKATAVRVA